MTMVAPRPAPDNCAKVNGSLRPHDGHPSFSWSPPPNMGRRTPFKTAHTFARKNRDDFRRDLTAPRDSRTHRAWHACIIRSDTSTATTPHPSVPKQTRVSAAEVWR